MVKPSVSHPPNQWIKKHHMVNFLLRLFIIYLRNVDCAEIKFKTVGLWLQLHSQTSCELSHRIL